MEKVERKSRLSRKILLGWLLVEIASIPVAAQVVDKVAFTVPERVIVADVPASEPGLASYLVSSNTAFTVEVAATVGPIDIEVLHTGQVNGVPYGSKAQLPGAHETCVQGRFGTVEAYRSDRKTAARRGSVQDQAVRVNVRYDTLAEPMIVIGPASESMSAAGDSCDALRVG